jgi:hypothetical protein
MGFLKGQSPLSNELVKKIIKKWKGVWGFLNPQRGFLRGETPRVWGVWGDYVPPQGFKGAKAPFLFILLRYFL